MTILNQEPNWLLWLDGGKMYDRKAGKTREIVGTAKAMLLAMYPVEKGYSNAKQTH